jgi:hypothetical protein
VEEDYGLDDEDDDHDMVQRQNDQDLVRQHDREKNDLKPKGKPKSDF